MSDQSKGSGGKTKLSVFYVAMISTAAVLSVRNFPSMAEEGWSMIFWYLIGGLLFLLPLGLAAAELASSWPAEGGVYEWVQQAFGQKTGFMSIWSVIAQNLPWYPAVLSFIAMSLVYGFSPALANNKVLMAGIMVGTFWLLTLLNFLGPNLAAKFTTFGTVFGSLIPAIVLIVGGILWVISGQKSVTPLTSASQLLPQMNSGTLAYVSTIVLMFTGLEMSGYYALEVRNPQRDYPKAMLLAIVIIMVISIFGTMPMIVAVPTSALSLNGGIVQTFSIIFDKLGMSWVAPLMGVLLAVGGVALMSAWLLGPFLSLAKVSKDGWAPPIFRRNNRRGVPTQVLLIQAVIVTFLAVGMTLIPSMNQAYWMLSATVTAELAFYYLPIFAAVIKLRYSQPDTKRPFKIPGGTTGVWIVGGVGFVSTAFAVFEALQKPSNITNMSNLGYIAFMIIFALLWMAPYFVWVKMHKPSWKETDKGQPAQVTGAPTKPVSTTAAAAGK